MTAKVKTERFVCATCSTVSSYRMFKVSTSLFTTFGKRNTLYFHKGIFGSSPIYTGAFRNQLFCPAGLRSIYKFTTAVSMSPGEGLISSGEVTEERVVRGVRGEGSVSHALYPLGGGVGI